MWYHNKINNILTFEDIINNYENPFTKRSQQIIGLMHYYICKEDFKGIFEEQFEEFKATLIQSGFQEKAIDHAMTQLEQLNFEALIVISQYKRKKLLKEESRRDHRSYL